MNKKIVVAMCLSAIAVTTCTKAYESDGIIITDPNNMLETCNDVVTFTMADRLTVSSLLELQDVAREEFEQDTAYYEAVSYMIESKKISIKSHTLMYEWLECDLVYELYQDKGVYYESEYE